VDVKNLWDWLSGNTPKSVPKPIQTPLAPVAGIATEATTSKKLGHGVVLFILINSILGSSLFYLPSLGVIASGSASIIAWVVLFILASFMMLYVGELVTLHPTSGGTYEFTKLAYGHFGSFFVGWLIWIAGNLGMALNVTAAAQYFIPETSSAAFILQIIFVVIWIVVLNFMAYRGIDAGATMLVVFGVIAVIVVLFMIIPSFIDLPGLLAGHLGTKFDPNFISPFFQQQGIGILAYLGLTLFIISEAFFGFEAVSYMANEVKEPRKLHRTLLAGIIICGVIMTLYILSSLGTVTHQDYITNSRPFAVQALNTLGKTGETLVVFGMYLVIVGAAAAWPITGSRLIQAMASDKLFIKQLAALHPKHKSPYKAVFFQTIIIFAFTWLIFRGYTAGWTDPYRVMYLIYVLLSLLVLCLVLLTVPVLRKKEAHLERPFTAPFGKVGPIILVIIFLVLIGNWMAIEGGSAKSILQIAASFVILGFPFYFMVEMFYNPKAIVTMNERLSSTVVIFEKIFFPYSIRNQLLKDMGDIRGKVILEFGCSSGVLTKRLAPLVTEKGRIYATDISLSKVEMVQKSTSHFSHVSVHHHPHLDDFKLQLPQKVDGVISVGMLSYMQHPQQMLTSLAQHVKPGGEIVFLDYDKFFYVIPNIEWIQSDAHLRDIFTKAGFKVEIVRKRGLLWQYIIINGVRI